MRRAVGESDPWDAAFRPCKVWQSNHQNAGQRHGRHVDSKLGKSDRRSSQPTAGRRARASRGRLRGERLNQVCVARSLQCRGSRSSRARCIARTPRSAPTKDVLSNAMWLLHQARVRAALAVHALRSTPSIAPRSRRTRSNHWQNYERHRNGCNRGDCHRIRGGHAGIARHAGLGRVRASTSPRCRVVLVDLRRSRGLAFLAATQFITTQDTHTGQRACLTSGCSRSGAF